MCLTAHYNISDQETDESCGEIEVYEIPTQPHPNPTLVGNPSTQAEQLTALVSDPDTTAEGTVLGRSHKVADIMSGMQTMEVWQEELELTQGQQQVHPNQESDYNPIPVIKLKNEEIDVVGVEDTQS